MSTLNQLKTQLSDLEGKLADAIATKQRLARDIMRANAGADGGDRAALLSQPRLNREFADASLAVTAFEGHVANARRRPRAG